MYVSSRGSSGLPLLAAGLLLLAPLAFADPTLAPRDLIKMTTEQLVTALQVSREDIRRNPELAWRLADDIVLPHIDFRLISRRVLGKHWRTANAQQRERFTREFSEFLTNVYVTAMVTYADDIVSLAKDIKYPPVHWSPGKRRADVRMLVKMSTGARAEVVYRMRWHNGEWKIHDVTILGVSFTLTYRNDFSREVARAGLDTLIDRLAARNRQTRQTSQTASKNAPEG